MLPFQASHKIHAIFQNVFPMPYAVYLPDCKVVNSHLDQKPVHKIIRLLSLLIVIFFFIPTLVWRLIWLIFHWKSYTVNNIVEIIVYVYFLTLALIFLAAYYTKHKHTQEIKYLSNQLFQFVKTLAGKLSPSFLVKLEIQLPVRKTKATVMDLLVYSSSIPCYIVLIGTVFSPFVIPYEPIQFVYTNSSLPIKLFSSLVYFLHCNLAYC